MKQNTYSSKSRKTYYVGGVVALSILAGGMAYWFNTLDSASERPLTNPVATEALRSEGISQAESINQPRSIAQTDHASERELSAKSNEGYPLLAAATLSLAEALSEHTTLAPKERIYALQEHFYLEEPLNAEEAALLMDFLSNQDKSTDVSDSTRRALKNDVMNLLSLRLKDQAPFLQLLEVLQLDNTQDPVIRDYALQFLASLNGNGQATDGHGLQAQWSAIEHTVNEKHVGTDEAMFSATSLLHVLSAYRHGQLSASEIEQLKQSALRISTREDISDDARSTALQVCGQLKMTEAAELASGIAKSNRNDFALRIAAIATLGQTSTSDETVVFLQGLTDGPNARLRYPAQAALNNIYASQQ